MNIDKEVAVFSSGRTVYVEDGHIGLGADGVVSYGYDGHIYDPDDTEPGFGPCENGEQLSDADLAELAEYMIRQWLVFKEKHVYQQEVAA